MADIDVVKKGSRAWLWILLLVLAVLAVWFLMQGSGTPETYGMLGTDRGSSVIAAALSHAVGALS